YIDNKKKGISASEVKQKPVAATVSHSQTNDAPKPAVPVAVADGDTVIAMDPIRKIIADRMTSSKKISPHVTNVIEVDVTKLVKWREENKDAFKKREGISLTYMSPIVEATAKALKDFPRVNSSVDGYNI
ncbi:2-oxo acid dehydrogenase subunit E2, partial [Enterobacter roggenkampii]|nr:2-oxo acid dehydrogenase subunit E2 [Enterobacter roggenkampii]